MSSVREPAVDVQAVTLVPISDKRSGDSAGSAIDERTLGPDGAVAGTGTGGAHADLAELEPGAVIARYRILGRLGAGGMGVVYRAHDAQLDRDVALKLLRIGEDGTEGRTRMLREAKAAAKIRHPNVVTVYDAGEVFGRVFIAMELIDGVTLKAHFRGRKRAWREVVDIMLGAGEGLAAAHAASLVHRDFKPDNVLVEAGGRVRVLDFGLARPATDAEGPTIRATAVIPADGPPVMRTLTQTGMLVGTPAYMAPEQHLARGVDARSDQFAYCVTLYECLYGQRPFAGDTQAELTMNVVEGRLQAPPRDRDVPPEIFGVLQRGLAVHPADRYDTLGELLAELRAIVRRHEPRDRKGLYIAAALMLPLIGGLAFYAGAEHEDARTPDEPRAKQVEEPDDAPSVVGGVTGAVTVVPERHGVTLGPTRRAPLADVMTLIDGILPDGTDGETVPEGLRIAGPDAARWKDAGAQLLTTIDADFGHRPQNPLVTQVPTPDGNCGVYILDSEDFAGRVQAIRGVDGVTRVSASEALRAILVLGDGRAQTGVGKLLRELKAPKYREWCFVNEKMGDRRECWPTRERCDKEAREWFEEPGRCRGVK
jgi:hypothetical protein